MQIAVTREEVDSFMCCTLLGVQQLLSKEKSLSEVIKDGLESLIEKGLLKGTISEKDHDSKSTLTITPLGKAAYKGKAFFIFINKLQWKMSCREFYCMMLWTKNGSEVAHDWMQWEWGVIILIPLGTKPELYS